MGHTTHLHQPTQVLRTQTYVLLVYASNKVQIDREDLVDLVEIVYLVPCSLRERGRVESLYLAKRVNHCLQNL